MPEITRLRPPKMEDVLAVEVKPNHSNCSVSCCGNVDETALTVQQTKSICTHWNIVDRNSDVRASEINHSSRVGLDQNFFRIVKEIQSGCNWLIGVVEKG